MDFQKSYKLFYKKDITPGWFLMDSDINLTDFIPVLIDFTLILSDFVPVLMDFTPKLSDSEQKHKHFIKKLISRAKIFILFSKI